MRASRPRWLGAGCLFGWSVFIASLAVLVFLRRGFNYGTSDLNRITAESQPVWFWGFEIACAFIAAFLFARAVREFRLWRQHH
jgi:hypothetical protein